MSIVVQVQVFIIGVGLVGVMLVNLLGIYGIFMFIIECNLDVLDYLCVVGIDDEVLCIFQFVGMVDVIVCDVIQNVFMCMYIVDCCCFVEIQLIMCEFGWYCCNLFLQLLGEVMLCQGLQCFLYVELCLGVELLDLVQDEQGVLVIISDVYGMQSYLVVQYVVGCDGGCSIVCEKIFKLFYEGKIYFVKWVVIECDGDLLDVFYIVLYCELQCFYVCLVLFYGVWCWEFMLFFGEDGEQMLVLVKVCELLCEYVVDVDVFNIICVWVYIYNLCVVGLLVCGCICLVGDVVYIMLLWIGQGLNVGLCDVFNLVWKLVWVLQGWMKFVLLVSYYDECYVYVKVMIDLVDLFGVVLL